MTRRNSFLAILFVAFGLLGITRTPILRGRVTDNGRPVQKAIVTLQWMTSPLIAMGPTGSSMGKRISVVSDQEGYFQFKAKVYFCLGSLRGVEIEVLHPILGMLEERQPTWNWYRDFLKTHKTREGAIVRNFDYSMEKPVFSPLILYYFVLANKMNVPYSINDILKEWDRRYKDNVNLKRMKDEISKL